MTMRMRFHRYDLPLRHVFTISRGSTSVQPTFIVELRAGELRGYGEATTNRYYGASYENMEAALETVREIVEAADPRENPEQLWDAVKGPLSQKTFALCALDMAAHDLWGKLHGRHVYELWGLDASHNPPTDYTIGIDEIPVMIAKLREMPGWPVYKIKLGTANDLEIVRALRGQTDAVFRVDANCGWTAAECLALAPALAELGVEFIEQPLAAGDVEGMREVYPRCALPVIADESCVVESDVEACQGLFHGVNIKLCKCGGLTPGRRMALRARELGMKTMCGCMTESSVGITAIAQLLPLLDYVDADGAVLLAEDIAEGATVDRGVIRYAAEPGVRLIR